VTFADAVNLMSASPQNAGLELVPKVLRPERVRSRVQFPVENARASEALQSLLAFAALHQQILERRKAASSNRLANPASDQELESFVLDEVLQLVAKRALTMTGADGIAIALAENNAIVCRASAGAVTPDAGARVDLNSGFSGECLVSGSVVRCDDSEHDARVDPAACRRLGARSMLAVPLSAKQTVVGLIEAFASEPNGFNDCDIRSLNLLQELILAAIRPEEEDRLAEISKKIVAAPAVAEESPKISVATNVPLLDNGHEQASTPTNDPIVLSPTPSAEISLGGYAMAEPSRSSLWAVVGVLCLAIVLGGALWWIIRRSSHFTSKPQPRIEVTQPAVSAGAAAGARAPLGSAKPSENDESNNSASLPVSPAKSGLMTSVTGIRHWASNDSSTVVIDLEDQVQYEAHRLNTPERIYLDLHDTRLSAGLSGKSIEVKDAFLERIRVAQPVRGITRVVLETRGRPDFSVRLEQNPYRLAVEIHQAGTKPPDRASIDLFAPASPTNDAPANSASLIVPSAPGTFLKPYREAPAATSGSLPSFRIALDAGHGGWDLGTVGRTGLLEKDLVLDIVARLGKLVEERLGATVIYTRHNDDYLALEKRAEIANLSHADLFLSVHANYSDFTSARGVETYYTDTYSSMKARDPRDDRPSLQNINWTNVDIRAKVHDSHLFAASVQHALYGMMAARNPGLPNRGVKEAQYVVLTGTSMPAVLAEVSFVSSPADEDNLKSPAYRQQIAEALYQGVAHYAKDSTQVQAASSNRRPLLR
jgi:N-acetylmuramoyl-L-alanine amidase